MGHSLIVANESAENKNDLSNPNRQTEMGDGDYHENVHGSVYHVAGNLIQPAQSNSESTTNQAVDINTLVTQLRQQITGDIETRCGTMRIFDMTQPIGIGKIYTQVNILEKISGRRRKEIAELFKNSSLEDFERFNLGQVAEEKIPGETAVRKHSQLLILASTARSPAS